MIANEKEREIYDKILDYLVSGNITEEKFLEAKGILDSYEEKSDKLDFQRARLYRIYGNSSKNIDILKESFEIMKKVYLADRTYYVVMSNLVKICYDLSVETNDKEYIEYAVNVMRAAHRQFDKKLTEKVYELYNNFGTEPKSESTAFIFRNVANEKEQEACNLISELLGRIYKGAINFEDIEKADIDKWDKELVKLAYYDKFNKKKGLSLIKQLKTEYKDDAYKIKMLKKLYPSFENTKLSFYDVFKYSEIMGIGVDYTKEYEYKPIESHSIKNEIKKQKPIEVKDVKKEKVKPVYVSVTGKNVSSRYNNVNNNIVNNNEVKERIPSIYEYYQDECNDIGAYLYASTYNLENRRNAVKALDNFYSLVAYPITTKEKLEKFITILEQSISLEIVKNDVAESRIVKSKNYKNN